MIGSPHTLNSPDAATLAHELIDPADAALKDNLGKVFQEIGDSEGTAFLHMDSARVTVGHAQPIHPGNIDLLEKISCNGRSSGVLLGLNGSGVVKLVLNDDEPDTSEPQDGQLHLTLGRNVYSAHIGGEYREQAIRRMLVPNERLLVVGDLGISSFVIHATQMYGTVTGEDAKAALRKSAALGSALDALQGQAAPAAEV